MTDYDMGDGMRPRNAMIPPQDSDRPSPVFPTNLGPASKKFKSSNVQIVATNEEVRSCPKCCVFLDILTLTFSVSD